MALTYPNIGCTTAQQRTEYLYALQERLRKIHNTLVKVKDGTATLADKDQLPAEITDKYDIESFNTNDMKDFILNDFQPRQQQVSLGLTTQRELLKISTVYTLDPMKIMVK